MSYIKKESEKKGGGKVNLLLTCKDRLAAPSHPDPMENGNFVHFIYSRLIQERGPIQVLKTVVFSLDLCNQKSFGFVQIKKHQAQQDYDVSDYIHGPAYVRGIMGAKTGEEVGKAWGSEQNTTFIPGLTYDGWMIAQALLIAIRNERIENRAKKPRQQADQKFKDDLVDKAIGQILSRVNAIMNQLLFLGSVDAIMNFSPDTMVYT